MCGIYFESCDCSCELSSFFGGPNYRHCIIVYSVNARIYLLSIFGDFISSRQTGVQCFCTAMPTMKVLLGTIIRLDSGPFRGVICVCYILAAYVYDNYLNFMHVFRFFQRSVIIQVLVHKLLQHHCLKWYCIYICDRQCSSPVVAVACMQHYITEILMHILRMSNYCFLEVHDYYKHSDRL